MFAIQNVADCSDVCELAVFYKNSPSVQPCLDWITKYCLHEPGYYQENNEGDDKNHQQGGLDCRDCTQILITVCSQ